MKAADTAPDCFGPLDHVAPPAWKLPDGAWDTHFHVLGPQARFPYAATRKYTPPDAPVERCLGLHNALGIARGLVVHANTHGFDNSVDLDAVARSDGRYLAVVRLNEETSRKGCRALHAAGARGVRFAFNPHHGGNLDLIAFNHVLHCIGDLPWFVELHFDGADLPKLSSWIASIPAKVLIDHMGRIDPAAGLHQEPFKVLAELARLENVWIKLSGADRISATGFPYEDLAPFVRRLADVAPTRLLWGSDWPHTGFFEQGRVPDDGRLLDALAMWLPEVGLRHSVLVDNPQRLLCC